MANEYSQKLRSFIIKIYINPSRYVPILIKFNSYGLQSSPAITWKYDDNAQTWVQRYSIVDYLGSLRASMRVDDEFDDITLYEYTPYGSVLKQYGKATDRLKYIGKEVDSESGDANHGVRQYSQLDGRFYCPDALWEKYYLLSPYQYSGNNPIGFLDDNGYIVAFGQVEGRVVMGGASLSGSLGIAIDHKKDMAIFLTIGGGVGAGEVVGIGASFGVFTKKDMTVSDLKGFGIAGGAMIPSGGIELSLTENGESSQSISKGTAIGIAAYLEINHTSILAQWENEDTQSKLDQLINEAKGAKKELLIKLRKNMNQIMKQVQESLNNTEEEQKKNEEKEAAQRQRDIKTMDESAPSSSAMGL